MLTIGGVETLCVLGGKTAGPALTDAWATTDLITWNRLTASDLDS